jgi:hypothetical protein
MKKVWRAMNSPQISAVLAVVKIAALCFSVGEGLRLTPFPVPTFSEAQFAQVSVTDSPDKTFLSQYGPLDVPAQNQKRSKRQVLQLAGSTAAEAREIVPESSPFSHHESLDVASVLLVPRTAGRAPPFLL